MTWVFVLLGITLTLGGYCICCGCTYCNDGTTLASLQIDLGGITEDADNGTGCCDALNQSYQLDIDPDNPCRFTITYENGNCATDDCTACDTSGCTVTCDEVPLTKICEPGFPLRDCSRQATIGYDVFCDACVVTEGATIDYPEGSADACTCSCVVSSDVWDTDVMIIDHPEATWAVTGEFVYYCDCAADTCGAAVGKSAASITATIGNELPPGVTIRTAGTITGGTFATLTSISTDPDIACVTEINALDLAASLSTTPCAETSCLCTLPTTIEATYIP